MPDAEPGAPYQQRGIAAVAYLAAAFQAAGPEAIEQAKTQPDVRLDVLHNLNLLATTTDYGQQLDVQKPADELDYWCIVRTKSSPFFRAVVYAGARLDCASRGGCTIA